MNEIKKTDEQKNTPLMDFLQAQKEMKVPAKQGSSLNSKLRYSAFCLSDAYILVLVHNKTYLFHLRKAEK
jgi:hypothetical protein